MQQSDPRQPGDGCGGSRRFLLRVVQRMRCALLLSPWQAASPAMTSFTEQLSVPECLTLTLAGLSFIQWKINENCTNLVKHDALRRSPLSSPCLPSVAHCCSS